MKKLTALILVFICLCCSPNILNSSPEKTDQPDMDKMEWTGWYKDKDSINHNILYAPLNDSTAVKIIEITY